MLTSRSNDPRWILATSHHHRKWKSSILGVEQIVLCDVCFASIFLAYVEPNLFFYFTLENSPVQPLTRMGICVRAYQCAQTLFIYLIWMWDAVLGGCQSLNCQENLGKELQQ